MKEIKVKVTFIIPVQVPEDEDYDEVFDIEENHCPATGIVGAALNALIEKHDAQSTCWGCSVGGKNEIVSS